jgi:hypothetical protein
MPICRKAPRTRQRLFQNSIFTVVSSLKRPTLKTQRSLQENSPSQRLSRMSSSRTTHVLNIKTCMNNYSSTQELLSFKASMSHLMIHCKSIMTHRQCNHHVTQLTTSTISNYTFYIILHCTHSSSHQSSNCSNNCQNTSARYTLFPKRISTSNLKNTSSYLCCGMNLCGHWRRQY